MKVKMINRVPLPVGNNAYYPQEGDVVDVSDSVGAALLRGNDAVEVGGFHQPKRVEITEADIRLVSAEEEAEVEAALKRKAELPVLDGMNTKEKKDILSDWAMDNFGVDLDKRKSVSRIIKECKKLISE